MIITVLGNVVATVSIGRGKCYGMWLLPCQVKVTARDVEAMYTLSIEGGSNCAIWNMVATVSI